MTAKEFVKQHFPSAQVEHYKTRDVFDKKGYWLCWTHYKREEKQRLSEGNSESNAWVNAKKNILETINNL